VLKHWHNIKITSFTTDTEKKEYFTKGETANIECSLQLGHAPVELFCVELFYMLDNSSRFKVFPMQMERVENMAARYKCSFEIEGYGLQDINVRVKPANEIVQDLHPELIKWAE
jgi:hypothetical protein